MWRNKYFIKRNCLPEPITLFQDYNGIWAPLGALYWSTSSLNLVSRHPLSCIEEIVSYYCPQCCLRISDDDAGTYLGKCSTCSMCPLCQCVLVPTPINGTGEATTTPEFALCCSECSYSSAACGITDADKKNVEKLVMIRELDDPREVTFRSLLTDLQTRLQVNSHSVSKRSQTSSKTPPPATDPTPKLEASSPAAGGGSTLTALELASNSTATAAVLLPIRVPLMTKRTIRSRLDHSLNKMSILVTPKPNPLDGDSGVIIKGKWWDKDSSAVTVVPFVCIVAVIPSSSSSAAAAQGNGFVGQVVIKVSNPLALDVEIVFGTSQQQGTTGGHPVLSQQSQGESGNEDDNSVFAPFDAASLRIQMCSSAPSVMNSNNSSSSAGASQGDPQQLQEQELLSVCVEAFEDELLREDTAATSRKGGSAAASNVGLTQETTSRPTMTVLSSEHQTAMISIPFYTADNLAAERPAVEGAVDGVCVLPLAMQVFKFDAREKARLKKVCATNLSICVPASLFAV